jgi:hypothetical protein
MQVAPSVNDMKNRAHKIGLVFFTVHIAMFILALLFIALSGDPQASLIWVIFAIADFPVSLLYMLKAFFSSSLDADLCCGLTFIFYLPYLVHGIFGAIWWYLLPRLFMPRRLGGIWGSKLKGSG